MDIPIAMTLAEFNMFDTMPNWVDPFVGTPAERAAKLALPRVRAAMRSDLERSPHHAFVKGWTLLNVLETRKESNHRFDGLSAAQIAADDRQGPAGRDARPGPGRSAGDRIRLLCT